MAQLRVSCSGVRGGGGSLNVSPPLGFSNCFTEYLIASIWKNEAKPECWGMSLSQAIATGLFCPRDSLFHSFYHREVGDGSLACAGAERSRNQPCLMGWVLLALPLPPCPPHCLGLVWFQALVELCPSPERIMGMLAHAQAPSQGVSAHLYHHQTCWSGGKSSSEDFTGIQHEDRVGILVTPRWWQGWMVSVWNVKCLRTGRDFSSGYLRV